MSNFMAKSIYPNSVELFFIGIFEDRTGEEEGDVLPIEEVCNQSIMLDSIMKEIGCFAHYKIFQGHHFKVFSSSRNFVIVDTIPNMILLVQDFNADFDFYYCLSICNGINLAGYPIHSLFS